ncbi:hypothetical protein Scep_022499 [Stephania cephalantha]|uniref:Uncharacterized protein n=1 Tax=Stephania cephalantha TaxID=152367 RepID=A0AAP0F5I1_9MAGN
MERFSLNVVYPKIFDLEVGKDPPLVLVESVPGTRDIGFRQSELLRIASRAYSTL